MKVSGYYKILFFFKPSAMIHGLICRENANLQFKPVFMLLQFSVSNFRSFKDEQFITMIPAKVKGHEENIAHVEPGLDVLRSAVIYGANASGKSNFIKAFETLNNLIKLSSLNKPGEHFKEYEPFKLSTGNKKKPVKFGIDLLIERTQYHYELSYSQDRVVYEKLSFFPQKREAKLFERIEQEFIFGEYLRGPKKILEQTTAPNQLFLSKGATNNVHDLVKVAHYFDSKFYVSSSYKDEILRDTGIAELASDSANSRFSKNVKKLISILDTGVTDYKIEKREDRLDPYSESTIPRFLPLQVRTMHSFKGKTEAIFDLADESTGTQKLFGLSVIIMASLEAGGRLIFDELERSLHPHISRFIISLFNNPKINKNNAQLIAATHDVTLLSEENKLRRDQIWIVEKNEQGASQMISLADMKGIRDNVPFEKWYLSGRFGGVPNIESLQFEFDFADEKTENNSNGAH